MAKNQVRWGKEMKGLDRDGEACERSCDDNKIEGEVTQDGPENRQMPLWKRAEGKDKMRRWLACNKKRIRKE